MTQRLTIGNPARRKTSMLAWVAVTVAVLSARAQAGDWPQILGPARNGQAENETLLTRWPKNGPQVAWSFPIGQGYAGPAVQGNRVIVFHRINDQERIEALDLETGRSVWKTDFPARYRGGVNADTGPRCVPVIHDGNVFVFGAAGELHAVRLSDGAKQWSRDAYGDYRGKEGYFGAGSTPIVANDKLLVNVGGSGAGIVAFQISDGRTAWKSTDEGASYSSPTLATWDGRETAVFVTRMNVVAVDPKTGKEQFRFAFGERGPTVNAATPLVFKDNLFVTASYGIGAVASRIADGRPKATWENDRSLSSQYTTPVLHQGYLFGTHGREDIGRAELRCVHAATGRVRWGEPDFGVAHVIAAGDLALALTVEGRLTLFKLDSEAYSKLAEAQVARGGTRSLPALASGRLLIRVGLGGGGKLVCLKVGK